MALILLRVLLLGVFAAAVDDVPVTWSSSPRWALLACSPVDSERVQLRRPPPPLDEPPRPRTYLWRRGYDDVSAKRIWANGSLEVSRKGGEGEGLYQCGARHRAGVVLGLPVNLKFPFLDKQFSEQPEDVEAPEGQPLAIPCRISSGPLPTVTWLKDGEPLPKSTRYHILQNQLLITDLKKEDEGAYSCRAYNSILNKSKVSREGRVTVVEPVERSLSMLPLFEEEYARPRGSTVVLACPVLGWPRPRLIWTLMPPEAGARSNELESSDQVLVLRHLDDDQVGFYTCAVEEQTHIYKTFNVSYTEEVVITNPPLSKEVMRASTVRFNCTARGSPKPTITWYKDGELLELAGRINPRMSVDRKRIELVISGVTSEDAGVYQCFASNGVSVSSQWAELSVPGHRAAAPRDVTCAPAGPTSILVCWQPLNVTVTAYTVSFNQVGGAAKTTQPHQSTCERVSVRAPLAAHRLQVRAFIVLPSNRTVASDISRPVTCHGQGVPIKLLKLDNSSVLVSWSQFAELVPAVQWMLQYTDDYRQPGHIQNVTLDGGVHNYTLNVATPLYTRVLGTLQLPWLAQNLSLVPWSSTQQARDHDGEITVTPYSVRAEVIDGRLQVRWRCAQSSAYHYRVCAAPLDGNEICRDSTTTTATFDNIEPDSEYVVRVSARAPNSQLLGPFSAPLHVKVESPASQQFANLTYRFVNSTTLLVSWSSGERDAGGVGGSGDAGDAGGAGDAGEAGDPEEEVYTVRYSARLQLPVDKWPAVQTKTNTVLITGIEPSERTFVMVSGHSPVVYSPILTVPPQTPAIQSKELEYEYTSSGVRVRWGAGGGRSVRVSQNLTQPIDTWRVVNVTGTSVELNDLDPNLAVHLMVSGRDIFSIPPRPADHHSPGHYIGIGLGIGFCVLCVFAAIFICVWRKKKMSRTRHGIRSTVEQDGSELREMSSVVTGTAAGSSAHARLNGLEPLLNGHVHIIDNPNSKTPNGKVKRGRRYDALDLSRQEPDTSDCRHDIRPASDNSLDKLPDDNMNSELTRSTLDNSKVPTLQPNG